MMLALMTFQAEALQVAASVVDIRIALREADFGNAGMLLQQGLHKVASPAVARVLLQDSLFSVVRARRHAADNLNSLMLGCVD
jgi:hypothetical protein